MPARLTDDKIDLERISMMVPPTWRKRIDDWRSKQPGVPNLSAAIRTLVDKGIESDKAERRAARR